MKRILTTIVAAWLLVALAVSGCAPRAAFLRPNVAAAPGSTAGLEYSGPKIRSIQSFVREDSGDLKVLVAFKTRPGQAEEALVRSHGGKVTAVFKHVNGLAATLPEAALEGLSHNPNVLLIEPNTRVTAHAQTEPWGITKIGAQLVRPTNTGTGIKVAVLDSGIRRTHEDLDAIYAGGWDFVNNDNDPTDDNGHGTHVAGTVAAEDNTAGVVGVAPGVSLYAVKVLDAAGSGDYGKIIQAIDWCIDNGMQVTNNSYGSSERPEDYGFLLDAAFTRATTAGILNIASAGNSGNKPGTGDNVSYPARYASVVGIASTDSTDKRSSFSSTGPEVELAAPGSVINSSLFTGDNAYGTKSGTSMAAPHVTGAVALLLKAGWPSSQVIGRLKATATPLGSALLYGAGRINVDTAVQGAPQPPAVSIASPTNGAVFGANDTVAFAGSASDAEDGDLTTVISWTSDLDGPIGTGGSLQATASEGVHLITARVTDNDGLSATATVSIQVGNAAPVVTISSPYNGQSFTIGSSIDFTGSALDFEDGVISAGLTWTDAQGATLATGPSFSTVLPEGTHTVTASATDLGGRTTSTSVTISVENQAPAVTISSPTGGQTFPEGSSIVFTGSAADAEDGDLSPGLTWKSGTTTIGIGPSFSAVLPEGTHTITASVSDSGGKSGSAGITITVVKKLDVTVAPSKAAYVNNEQVRILATVTSGGAPVQGATGNLEILTANGKKLTGSSTTTSSGTIEWFFKASVRSYGAGTYTATVTASKTGYQSGTGSATFTVQ